MPLATPAAAPEVITATTAGLADRDKFDFWHDVVCRTVVDLECRPQGKDQFDASVQGVRFNAFSLSSIEATAHRVSRLPSGISRSGSDALIFNFVVAGRALAEQDGRSVVLGPGDGAVCDAERPYTLRFDNAFKVLAVKLPRAALSHRAASVHRVTALSLAESGQLCPILFAYLVGLTERAAHLGASSADKVTGNFVDLLGAALDEAISNSPLPLSEYRSMALMRVREFVERHLGDCELDPATVASTLKLSPRYINKLFEADGTSLSRYIWRRRVERAATDLRDPAMQALGISAIAMALGFNDLSHFSRVFRQRFGMSPRDYRVDGPQGH
jgi:AraC family transcriptional regulator, positive regulator of tynA and feaB